MAVQFDPPPPGSALPSKDQIKSSVGTLVVALGSLVFGLAVGKGWITQEQANAILLNPTVQTDATNIVMMIIGSGVAAAAGIWRAVARKQVNMVATVAAMPEIAEVKTMPTQAGVELQQAASAASAPIPGAVVTVAN